MIRTNDVMSEEELRAFYDMESTDSVEPKIETHNGDWIKEIKDNSGYPFPPVYQWRFWEHEGIHE